MQVFTCFQVFLIAVLIINISSTEKAGTTTTMGPYYNDRPVNYFNGPYVSNISYLPTSGQAPHPWSGSYWALVRGGIGYRYGAAYQIYNQPSDHYARYGSASFAQYVASNYSPAEKYDFLVGDYAYTLTRVTRYKMGAAASWEGICHGWAPASFLEPAPRRSVTITASDGKTPVTFYPDDIKALISQFYATAVSYSQTNKLGTNCNRYNGGMDMSCFDNNPATFFLVLANQLGLKKKNVLFDQMADPQVWNFPAYYYTAQYYNPLTNGSSNLTGSKISLFQAMGSNSSFLRSAAKNAASGTAYLIGVKVTVYYASENNPIRASYPASDVNGATTYQMILELDSGNNAVGGTWVSSNHPDFLWKFDERYAVQRDVYDRIGSFQGTSAELRSMTNTAKWVSSRSQVIQAIMRYLADRSS